MIKLIFLTNGRRELVCTLDAASLPDYNDIESFLCQSFEEREYSLNLARGHFAILTETGLAPLETLKIEENSDLTFVYVQLVYPNSAAEYDRKNGIRYYINSSEKPHKAYPHVHAECADGAISVSLKDYTYTGKFKSPSKEKEAIRFVKDNCRELLDLWEHTIS